MSTDFGQTRNEIISDSLQLLGVLGAGETATSNDLSFCSNMFNKMIKSWQAQGIHLFTENEGTIALTQGVGIVALSASGTEQSTYPELTSLGTPLNINSMRYYTTTGAVERKMQKMGRAEFMQIPNKTTQAPATAYFFSPQDTYGLLYIWPMPDNSVDTLTVSYTRLINDLDLGSDSPDFPVAWLETITYNLAVRIAPAYGISLSKTNPDVTALAATTLSELRSWDSEEGSVQITPDYRWDT